MTVALRGLGAADHGYLSRLEDELRRVAVDARSATRRVEARWGTAPVSIGINRRQMVRGSGIVLGRNPDGPADSLVRVLDLSGEGVSVILFEHASHPYCLGADCSLISPDFWGHAAAALAAEGHECIYFNGCAGDLGPRRAFGGPEAAGAEGARLADAVLKARARGRPEREPVFRFGSRRFVIPHDSVPPLARLESELQAADRTVRERERENPRTRERLKGAWQDWLVGLRAALKDRQELPPIPARVSAVRVGRGALVALPGEVFFNIGQRIASRLYADPVCAAAYCHGYIGYVPTPEAYREGGYEVEESHRYVGLWRVTPAAGSIMEGQVASLWQEIGG